MKKIIGIVKLENGNVRLINEDNVVNDTLQGPAKLVITQNYLAIQVRQQNQAHEYIVHADIQFLQILPASQVPFNPNTQSMDELHAELGENYFFSEAAGGGGSGLTSSTNGLNDNGIVVKLGGALIEGTSILETGFDFLQSRVEPVASGNGTTSFESNFADPLGWGFTALKREISGQDDNGQIAAIGVVVNGLNPTTAYLRQEAGDKKTLVLADEAHFLAAVYDGGIEQSAVELLLTDANIRGNRLNISSTDVRLDTDTVVQQLTGFRYWGDPAVNGSFRIGQVGGSFVVQKLIAGIWTLQNIAPNPITINKDELIVSDNFTDPSISSSWFSSTASGGNIDLNQAGEVGVVGICRFITSNNNASRYGISAKGIASLIRTYQDGSTLLYKTKVRPEALSTALDRFVINAGFLTTATIQPLHGLFFTYDFNNSQRVNPNVLNWSLVSRINNVDKAVLNSGVAVQIGVWTKLAIEINTATNTANFYINTILVGSIVWNGLFGAASNLPMVGAATECTWGACLANAAVAAIGTGLRLDYIDLYKDFT